MSAAHVTRQELERFRTGGMPADKVLALTGHLSRCSECRELARQIRPATDAAAALASAIALPADETPHVSSTMVRRLRRWRTVLIAAIAASLVLAVTAAVILAPRRRNEPAPGTTRIAAAGYGRADWDALVRSALASGRLSVPDDLRALQRSRGALRSPAEPPRSMALQPAGAVVEQNPPEFTWQPMPGAGSYVVIVYSEGREAARSGSQPGTRWRPPAPLPAGKTYEWQVIATMDDGRSATLPRFPNPSPLFRTLTAAASADLAEATRRFPNDHLLLGVLFAHHGVTGRAEDELRRWTAEHRGDARMPRMVLDKP